MKKIIFSRAYKIESLVNKCRWCDRKIPDEQVPILTLKRFVGVEEASSKITGDTIYFAQCPYCQSIYYHIKNTKLLNGDYRIIKIDN